MITIKAIVYLIHHYIFNVKNCMKTKSEYFIWYFLNFSNVSQAWFPIALHFNTHPNNRSTRKKPECSSHWAINWAFSLSIYDVPFPRYVHCFEYVEHGSNIGRCDCFRIGSFVKHFSCSIRESSTDIECYLLLIYHLQHFFLRYRVGWRFHGSAVFKTFQVNVSCHSKLRNHLE